MRAVRGQGRRRGFTIVELLMVVGILGVLIGIVYTAVGSAMRHSRDTKTRTLKNVVLNGITAYRSQNDSYPPKGGRLQSWSENGLSGGREVDYLSDTDYDAMMYEMASVSIKGSGARPVLAPTEFVVCNKSMASGRNPFGQEFKEAVKKNKKHGSTLSLSSMAFGYPETSTGQFRRFVVKYNGKAGDVTVMTQAEYKSATGRTWPSKP